MHPDQIISPVFTGLFNVRFQDFHNLQELRLNGGVVGISHPIKSHRHFSCMTGTTPKTSVPWLPVYHWLAAKHDIPSQTKKRLPKEPHPVKI
jgi:hypothetical protein